jgi:plasmid maintenance system antidote protein VapI
MVALDGGSGVASGRITFGQHLESRLRLIGLSQRELAERAGINHSTISRLVADQRGVTLNTAVCLLRALGDDIGVLGRIDL